MSIYDSLFSSSFGLNEQIARQIFDTLPEQGTIMLIMDKEGNIWPNNSEEFSKSGISESFLKELCNKVDDGVEPVLTQTDKCSIIAAQLATERTDCGYVIMALPNYSPESMLINIDLIEIVLNQISLIAKLIEKNTLLYELQIKNHCVAAQSYENAAALN